MTHPLILEGQVARVPSRKRGPHRWQPGESGNPAGRPPRQRALTEILRKYGDGTIEVKGKARKVARKRVLADLVWQAVNMGLVQFPDGAVIKLDGKAWAECFRWLYRQIDGDAPALLQVEDVSKYELAASAVRLAIAGDNGDNSPE